MIYDVIVVGAGPSGSSAASLLARKGASTLLLDRATFPRDKVCGDGLTPQAIYWLDLLGCAEEVLEETNACIKECDLYINGKHLLTGGFPDNTAYPDFAILLDRRRFDHILMRNAVANGARFEGALVVRGVELEHGCARVVAQAEKKRMEYRGRIVIGADGVTSAVSRSIGNTLKDGATAVSLRTYYMGAKAEGAQIKVYFDRDYFPGYGWMFVDDGGFANVGLGYAFDKNFPMIGKLGAIFQKFIDTDLAPMLKNATRCSPISGGSASFYRPKAIVGERVMLIGDAANQADPLNGGGIHKGMESAFCAAEAALNALSLGNFSAQGLRQYERLWGECFEADWQTAEIFLSIAKNPDLRDFCLFVLTQIGKLTTRDRRFQAFASGVFSGVIAQSICLSPMALYHAFPKDARAWRSLVDGRGGAALGSVRLARETVESLAVAGSRMACRPLKSLDWSMEVATKVVQLAERRVMALTDGAGPSAAV